MIDILFYMIALLKICLGKMVQYHLNLLMVFGLLQNMRKDIRKEWKLKKLIKAINSGLCRLEFLSQYKEYNSLFGGKYGLYH
jgi:hypothetical protein